MAKRKMDGTRIRFRPNLSAITPMKGARTIPGTVKAVMSHATSSLDIPRSRIIEGKAGAMLDTPITANRLIPKMICRLRSRRSGPSDVAAECTATF